MKAPENSAHEGASLPHAFFRVLARRFYERFRPAGCDSDDQTWVKSLLTPAEFELWTRLYPHDQSHSVRVARNLQHRLAGTEYAADTRWTGAAIMHDVGKSRSALSAGERVLAILAGRSARPATARKWSASPRPLVRRIGLYLTHGAVGADMIRRAGGREELALWAAVHQGAGDAAEPLIPRQVIRVLIDSDLE